MAVAVSRRRFTVHDYHRMGETGILSPTDRVELIDGEIVTKMAIGPRHGASVDRANRALTTTVALSQFEWSLFSVSSPRARFLNHSGTSHAVRLLPIMNTSNAIPQNTSVPTPNRISFSHA